MTLDENLAYVKHNIKNVQEAFNLFEITKKKFEDYPPYIPASIIQKIAVSTRDAKKIPDITTTNEYKAMLKILQRSMN